MCWFNVSLVTCSPDVEPIMGQELECTDALSGVWIVTQLDVLVYGSFCSAETALNGYHQSDLQKHY